MHEFNIETLESMIDKVNEIKSVYEVCEFCKNTNRIANETYLKEYPTHKDLLNIIEQAVTILENNIIDEYNDYIVENILNDIEFIIGQNVLTEAHIQRLLLGPITLQNLPIFKKKAASFRDRLNSLYNCESARYGYEYDEYKAMLPFNYHQLESYMRYNKVGYEEELVNNEYNGDYICEHTEFHLNPNLTDKINDKYPQLEQINVIDKFILEEHGLKPIEEAYDQFVHYKKGKQYNLYKQNGVYYMISESKSYKVTIKEGK